MVDFANTAPNEMDAILPSGKTAKPKRKIKVIKRTPEEKAVFVTKVDELKDTIGMSVEEATNKVGIATSQYYDWRKQLGKVAAKQVIKTNGKANEQFTRIRQLEAQNEQLKIMYVDLLLAQNN